MIVKPSEACQGKGIFFINDVEKLKERLVQEREQKGISSASYVV